MIRLVTGELIMPKFSKRDIFSAIIDGSADLAIIFGNIGFNSMHVSWRKFSVNFPSLVYVHNPFFEFSGKAMSISGGQWLWFVIEEKNHGMTDAKLISNLETALSWATVAGVKTVITNGLADTDHGDNKILNFVSDDRRARFLIKYASEQEKARGISIELTSLNMVFIRNVAQYVSG